MKKKKLIKLDYPYASVDLTQAKGYYNLYVAFSDNLHLSVTLTEKKLTNLEEDIESIRTFQKQILVPENNAKEET